MDKDGPPPVGSLDDALLEITRQPKRQFSQQEIDEARGNLALMNDRVFFAIFMENRNKHLIKGVADASLKIYDLAPIPPLRQSIVQDMSLLDVLGRGMVGDLFSWGESINLVLEAQKDKQEGYAIRGTLTSSNAMRKKFDAGSDFTEAPDVIGINILGFKLPQLEHRKAFVSRIIRSEYESKVPFLADKYNDFYIELPKMKDWKKEDLPEKYHDLWDLCCIFKAKIKEHEEVIRMQAISNPIALELSQEARKVVAPNEFVNETLNRRSELEQLRDYIQRKEQKVAQSAEQKGRQEGRQEGESTGMEKMIVTAFQCNATPEIIEAMRKNAGISEARLAELQRQTQAN